MGSVHSIDCGLPFCQLTEGKETNGSIGLRITAFALGTILALGGVAVLLSVPGTVGSAIGWSAIATGALTTMVAASIKCVKKHSDKQANESQSTIDETPVVETAKEVIPPPPPKKAPSAPKNSSSDKPSSTDASSITKAPESFLSQLPAWLKEEIAEIPHMPMPAGGELQKLKSEATAPITLFSDDPSMAIGLKLRVQHRNVDESYDRSDETTKFTRELLSSTQNPFSLFVVAWKQWKNDDFWLLTSEKTRAIEHRNGPFSTEEILGNNAFNCYLNSPLEEKTIEQFITTNNQEDLPPDYQYSLPWILLRLLKKGNLEVREKRTDSLFHSLKDPAVGYWQISLDK